MSEAKCIWCVPIILLSISYSVCAWHRPLYHYITATAVVYLVQRIMAACVVVIWSHILYRSRIVSADVGRGGSRRILVERAAWYDIHRVSYLRSQDVIGVCSSYCCLSGTTCVLLEVQYTAVYTVVCACHSPKYHYIIVTVVYPIQRFITAFVVIMWSQSLCLSRMKSQRGRY